MGRAHAWGLLLVALSSAPGMAGPLLWEKGSCQMGPQRRVWKITFTGPLYKEFMREVEPYGQVRVGSIHLPFVDLCAVPFTAELLLTYPLF